MTKKAVKRDDPKKKNTGKGGLDTWFAGHGGGKPDERSTWGDWVSITPVKKTITKEDGKKKTYEPGDIVGPCGLSGDPEWSSITENGKKPLKCMPREKAHKMPKKDRAELAKNKRKKERGGKKPTNTPTFSEKAKEVLDKKSALGVTRKARAVLKLRKAISHLLAFYGEDQDRNITEFLNLILSKVESRLQNQFDRKGLYLESVAINRYDPSATNLSFYYAIAGGSYRVDLNIGYSNQYSRLNESIPLKKKMGIALYSVKKVASSSVLIPHPPSEEEHIQELSDISYQYGNRYNAPELQNTLDLESEHLFSNFLSQHGRLESASDIKAVMMDELVSTNIVFHKKFFDISRPNVLAAKYGIPFEYDHLESAQTPTYPSGHTARAYYAAFFFAEKYPLLREGLLNIAKMVAQSRVDRGVHYPSDNIAGKLLAAALYEKKKKEGKKADFFREVYPPDSLTSLNQGSHGKGENPDGVHDHSSLPNGDSARDIGRPSPDSPNLKYRDLHNEPKPTNTIDRGYVNNSGSGSARVIPQSLKQAGSQPAQDLTGVKTWVTKTRQDQIVNDTNPEKTREDYEDGKPQRDRVLPLPSGHPEGRTEERSAPKGFNTVPDSGGQGGQNRPPKDPSALKDHPNGKALHERPRSSAVPGEDYGHPYIDQSTSTGLKRRSKMLRTMPVHIGEIWDIDEEANLVKISGPRSLLPQENRQKKMKGEVRREYDKKRRRTPKSQKQKESLAAKKRYRRNPQRAIRYQQLRRKRPVPYRRLELGGPRTLAQKKTERKRKENVKKGNQMFKAEISSLAILQLVLCSLRAAHWSHWTSHWQVKGKSFYGDHELMDRLYTSLIGEIDVLAEKIVGVAGGEALEPTQQAQIMANKIIPIIEAKAMKDPIRRALFVEEALQIVFKETYRILDERKFLSLGMDDFLMSIASNHETNLYLLRQRAGGRLVIKKAFNKYNPTELILQLYRVLYKNGLTDTVDYLNKNRVPKVVNDAWINKDKVDFIN